LSDGAGALLAVQSVPRGGRDGVAGERDGAVVIRIAAPALVGGAKAALVGFVAAALGVPRRDVEIVRGAASRDKLLRVHGMRAAEARAALRARAV
jgi:uncharacterized protein (TIGR00251 family)